MENFSLVDNLATNVPTILKAIKEDFVDQIGLLLSNPPASFFEYEYPKGILSNQQISFFHCAVLLKREKISEMLLKHGVNPNGQNELTGYAALHITAEKGYEQLMVTLINLKAKVDLADKKQKTPLWVAVMNSQLPCARILIKHGADPKALAPCLLDKQEEFFSLLHFLCHQQKDDVNEYVDLLVDAGADQNEAGGQDGFTPLHFSAAKETATSVKLIEHLVEKGANFSSKSAKSQEPVKFGS